MPMRRHGSWRHEQRAKRRRWFSRLLVLAVLIGAGWLVYDAGRQSAQSDLTRMTAEIDRLSAAMTGLDAHNIRLAAALETKRLQAKEWRRRYTEEVPSGTSGQLLIRIKDQLEAGVPSDRLAFLIRSASSPATCAEEPATRRFLVRTPIYTGSNDAVTFEENAITVTAHGTPAADPEGRPYAWFDPAKKVVVKLTGLGGTSEIVTGLLPLHHSFALGRDEVRFSFTKGDNKGFVHATATRCRIAGTNVSN